MEHAFKNVDVYVDNSENLIAIPHGHSKKYSMAGLDIILTLSSPYDDEQLAIFLEDAMSKCFCQEADDNSGLSSLEKHLQIKGYSKATKSRRLVGFEWFADQGYVLMPTQKKRGFVHMEDKKINLGHEVSKETLAAAFREAMAISI